MKMKGIIYRDAKGWSFMEGPTKQKENSIPKFNNKIE